MADRLEGLTRYAWPERGTASAVCKAEFKSSHCSWAVEKVNYATAAAQARAHTREFGHDTRVYVRRITEYSAEESDG